MSCELCEGVGPFLPVYPHLGIVRCSSCDLVFYVPNAPINASKLYGSHYFQGGEYRNYEEDRDDHLPNFRARIRDLKKLGVESGRLLEIGCAYGFFLELAKAEGFDPVGYDISGDAVQSARARGLDAREGDFLNLPDEPRTYQVVTLWDTIEHLSQPVKTLKKAALNLKRGGTLVLTTGDFGSLNARLRGKRWRQIHPPTHLYYFTRETLAKAFRAAGLEVVETRAVPMVRSFRSMAYGVFALGKGPIGRAIYRGLTFGGKLDFPVNLDLGDLVWMAGRKTD